MASRLYVLVVCAAFAVALPYPDGTGGAPREQPAEPNRPAATASTPRPVSAQPAAAAGPPREKAAASDVEELVRLHDFSPVSDDNPVLARVDGTSIEIPVSEFRAYLKAEVSEEDRKNLDLAGKKQKLDRLVDELIFLRDAYRRNVHTRENMVRSLESTRRLLLVEFLTREEVGDKAKSADHYAVLQSALEDRLFEKATVVVSNEGYAHLKDALAQHGSGKSEDLPTDIAAYQLAQCNEMKVSVGEAFATYVGLPPAKRPNAATQEGVSKLLKQLLMDGLKMAEARARGIDKRQAYRETVAANRASLTRMWLQDRMTDKAAQRMKTPETEVRLRKWYDDNLKSRYTYKDNKGVQKVISFETEKASIQNDYFDTVREEVRAERAAQLREGSKIEIDERLLSSG
ncbi:hypothetical protein LVJ94_28015 [Pendulispora rubella]|uniref:PpiC domain-containing protein n=1 Tax=Pendulispora rubella TaxID=2741070 RepID=A0ABZ2KQ42_9BACT